MEESGVSQGLEIGRQRYGLHYQLSSEYTSASPDDPYVVSGSFWWISEGEFKCPSPPPQTPVDRMAMENLIRLDDTINHKQWSTTGDDDGRKQVTMNDTTDETTLNKQSLAVHSRNVSFDEV